MAKQSSSINTRGIGLELSRLRRQRKMSCQAVGEALDTSASTISRIETGKKEPSSEEVASILTVLGVKGVERQQLIDQARRQDESGLVESTSSTEQSRNYRNFELKATKISDFELVLVPGLAQTTEYAYAVLTALRVGDTDEDIEAWVGQRMSRQSILTRKQPPTLHWILTETGLRLPIGGRRTMSRQVQHLADLAERPNITINVIPKTVIEHAGLTGQFVIMDFTTDSTIVIVEDRTTGLFLDDPDKVARYKLTVEKLTDVALDAEESLRLMRSIADDLHRE
ncbi:MAG TPA: helix-turn-helix transcriptional regulator [Pseudonocardiaceae bacterium]|nr:helix-turn-helix transcriptional regulator [Pseudonocardiaceae bacterium]